MQSSFNLAKFALALKAAEAHEPLIFQSAAHRADTTIKAGAGCRFPPYWEASVWLPEVLPHGGAALIDAECVSALPVSGVFARLDFAN